MSADAAAQRRLNHSIPPPPPEYIRTGDTNIVSMSVPNIKSWFVLFACHSEVKNKYSQVKLLPHLQIPTPDVISIQTN